MNGVRSFANTRYLRGAMNDPPMPSERKPDLRVIRSPLSLSRTPPTYRMPPPELGAHTQEVLQQELGLSASDIEKLKSAGAI